jgi:hypothetical protein
MEHLGFWVLTTVVMMSSISLALKKEAICHYETSVDFQRIIRRYIPEERTNACPRPVTGMASVEQAFLHILASHFRSILVSVRSLGRWTELREYHYFRVRLLGN